MRKFYQTQWHDVKFDDFYQTSINNLAGAEFYDAFYSILFKKYLNYDDLDVNWRGKKNEIADWLSSISPEGGRILSIGCGIGYIEQRICSSNDRGLELHVHDYAPQALFWLKKVLPDDRIHIGGAFSTFNKFDLIYLCAVDYAMKNDELISLLSEGRRNLNNNGKLIIISASFLEEQSVKESLIYNIKEVMRLILSLLSLRSMGQFWGWLRSAKEYREAMTEAGFVSVAEGRIESSAQNTYWIEGVNINEH